MPIKPEEITEYFKSKNIPSIHKTTKKAAYQLQSGEVIYINLTSKTGTTAIVLHPELKVKVPALGSIDGVSLGESYYHSSNLKHFPKRLHGGEGEIGYGLGITVKSFSALEQLLSLLGNGLVSQTFPEALEDSVGVTEREALINARVGQAEFRLDLLRYWQRCAVTGVENAALLKASHIKPWRDSDSKEKLDVFNGLLLAAHLDSAFDAGLISFSDEGQILISPKLSKKDAKALGITSDMALSRVEPTHQKYLSLHRETIYLA